MKRRNPAEGKIKLGRSNTSGSTQLLNMDYFKTTLANMDYKQCLSRTWRDFDTGPRTVQR